MRPFVVGSLIFFVTAAVFTTIAIVCTIAAEIQQDLVRKIPENLKPQERTSSVVSYPRREGFYHLCYRNTTDKINLDKASVECQNHDLGTDQRFAEFRDSVYNELIEWLRSSVAATLVAVFLAFVGLALMLYFIRFWLRTITLAEYHGYERLSVAFILMLSGFMYKMGLFFLHLEYVREKVTYSKNMPYIFTSWPLVIRQNTDIAYAHSYNLLWAALIFVELAAILLLLSMLLSFCLEDSDDSMEKTLNYKLSLPRYSTWDTSHPLPEEHEDEAEDDEEDEDAEELPPPPRKNMVYFNVD